MLGKARRHLYSITVQTMSAVGQQSLIEATPAAQCLIGARNCAKGSQLHTKQSQELRCSAECEYYTKAKPHSGKDTQAHTPQEGTSHIQLPCHKALRLLSCDAGSCRTLAIISHRVAQYCIGCMHVSPKLPEPFKPVEANKKTAAMP